MKVLIAFIALFGQLLSLIHLAMDRRTDFRNSDFYVSCQPCFFLANRNTNLHAFKWTFLLTGARHRYHSAKQY